MKFADMIATVVRYIRGRFLESLMVVIGIALGVGIISSVLAMTSLFTRTMRSGLSLLEVNVRVAQERYMGPQLPVMKLEPEGTPRVNLVYEDMEKAKAASPSVGYAYTQNMIMATRNNQRQEGQRSARDVVSAMTADYFSGYQLKAAKGSLFMKADEEAGAQVVVLGSKRAELLFPGDDPIGKSIKILDIDFKVIGVLAPIENANMYGDMSPDSLAYVPLKSSPQFARMRFLNQITYMAKDEASIRSAVSQLQSFFDASYGAKKITVSARVDQVDQNRQRMMSVFAVILLLAGSGLLIASINILNLMVARVLRRTKSIGISVAIGASKAGIFASYLWESLILGIVGGVLGIGMAFLFSGVLQGILNSGPGRLGSVGLSFPMVGIALILTICVNLIFGIYPAFQASRTNVVDALRAD
jgi:putative ABC transport system permease protein